MRIYRGLILYDMLEGCFARMRKYIKKKLFEIIKTMYKAHEAVKDDVDGKKFEEAVALLNDCQNTAADIGKITEDSEGEGTDTVTRLEEYCDVLYASAQTIFKDKNVNGRKIQKRLDAVLRKAEYSIRDNITTRTEVVFMPYKASMWDSLESVWKAAEDDANCDVYVVPIPYYDRQSSGAAGEYHYEGTQLPQDVRVTHYNDYSLEKHRPDVIFIHNPYDNANFVTSVDPRFYSSELKKYTDMLVYIPYFVLYEPNPDDEVHIKDIEHFVLTYGVLNADKVIVQSENMRKVYIKVLLKKMSDTPENRAFLERKILGLGSPKIDKAVNTEVFREDIPKEWENVIYKPDGERKKIVMYNTSVTAILLHNEKMIAKIRSSLKEFYENRDSTALLWRPHPLMEVTIKSMRPQLWEEYSDIVKEYRSGGWGIYDDTPNMDRAIALSNAYYGDYSSLVQLCQARGMPIMIQNVEVIEV